MTAPPLLAVRYYLELDGPQITGADYHSTTCVVLLAYSELLRDMAQGAELSVMLTLRDVDLISKLPDVPAARHDRATLVARAFHSAASAARES
jgi:NifU-like protein involved in Fe-S cluster formation